MYRRAWIAVCLCALLAPASARADQAQLFLGATAFTGVHKDASSVINNGYVVALPLYALRAERKQFEALVEDAPPMHVALPGATYGVHTVSVGYADAVARYWMLGGRLGVGLGDSLYVHENDYGNGSYAGVRAAGTRYELLGALPLSRGQRVVARFALAPDMHQRFMQWANGLRPFDDFGRASLVDASVQFEMPRGGRHTWVFGARYLNYAGGNYPPYWDHAEDRTGVVAAFAAWGFAFGRF